MKPSINVAASLIALWIVHFGYTAHAQDAANLLKRAQQAYDNENYDQAIIGLDDAVTLDPSLAAAYALRGRTHNEKQEFLKAVKDFDEALRLDSSLKKALGHRSWAYFQLGNFSRSIADCEEILRRDPYSGAAYAVRAHCYASLQDFERAWADANDAIRLGHDHAQTYFVRAIAAMRLGKVRDAATDLNRACELDPNDARYARFASAAWNELGETERAFAAAERLRQLDPTQEPFVCQIRAFAHDRAGEPEKARAEAAKGIELAPDDISGYVCRAEILCKQEDYRSAFEDCQRVFELSQPFPERYALRGRVYLGLDQHDLAIADLTEALRLNTKLLSAYSYRARVYARTGEYRAAIADCESFRRFSVQRTESMALLMSTCYLETGETAKALTACDEALSLDAESADALNFRAWILATSNDVELRDGTKALEDAEHACELTKWNDWRCLDTLAAAHAECGDFASAIKVQQNAIDLAPKAKHAGLQVSFDLYRDGVPYRMK